MPKIVRKVPLRVKLAQTFSSIKTGLKKGYFKMTSAIKKRPLISFFTALILLFLIIFIANKLTTPKPEVTPKPPVKDVQIYAVGESPKLEVQAQVEKTNVIKIVALSNGIISNISAKEGQKVNKGQVLVSMASNYFGGNALSVARQIAQTQYKNVTDTFDTQVDLINKQKDVANKSKENADQLRDITNQSISGTQALIDLNNDIIDSLSTNQKNLEASGSSQANDQAILQLKQLRSQFQSGNNQLDQALRNAKYNSASDKPPALLAEDQKNIALEQLDLQQKSLELNKEISRLSLMSAQINEAIMFPAAPSEGTVQRVYVRVGEAVTPGTPLVEISGTTGRLYAVAPVSQQIAQEVITTKPIQLTINNEIVEVETCFVSKEATDGELYSIIFEIPKAYQSKLADKSFIKATISVGVADTSGVIPFVPLDSIFQTQDEAFLFVAQGDSAQSRTVKLGPVLGRFVQIQSGLNPGDQVILDRNVTSGDKIKVIN